MADKNRRRRGRTESNDTEEEQTSKGAEDPQADEGGGDTILDGAAIGAVLGSMSPIGAAPGSVIGAIVDAAADVNWMGTPPPKIDGAESGSASGWHAEKDGDELIRIHTGTGTVRKVLGSLPFVGDDFKKAVDGAQKSAGGYAAQVHAAADEDAPVGTDADPVSPTVKDNTPLGEAVRQVSPEDIARKARELGIEPPFQADAGTDDTNLNATNPFDPTGATGKARSGFGPGSGSDSDGGPSGGSGGPAGGSESSGGGSSGGSGSASGDTDLDDDPFGNDPGFGEEEDGEDDPGTGTTGGETGSGSDPGDGGGGSGTGGDGSDGGGGDSGGGGSGDDYYYYYDRDGDYEDDSDGAYRDEDGNWTDADGNPLPEDEAEEMEKLHQAEQEKQAKAEAEDETEGEGEGEGEGEDTPGVSTTPIDEEGAPNPFVQQQLEAELARLRAAQGAVLGGDDGATDPADDSGFDVPSEVATVDAREQGLTMFGDPGGVETHTGRPIDGSSPTGGIHPDPGVTDPPRDEADPQTSGPEERGQDSLPPGEFGSGASGSDGEQDEASPPATPTVLRGVTLDDAAANLREVTPQLTAVRSGSPGPGHQYVAVDPSAEASRQAADEEREADEQSTAAETGTSDETEDTQDDPLGLDQVLRGVESQVDDLPGLANLLVDDD